MARVADIPLGLLRQWGTRGVLLDLDNTIVPWHTTALADDVRPWVASVQAAGVRMCLLSNNYSSMAVAVARGLSLPIVKNALKPFPFAFKRALRILMTEPHESVVVGDQLLTDVLGGKLVGMRAVLVTPLSKREFPTTKIVRLMEFPVLGYLRRSGRIAGG